MMEFYAIKHTSGGYLPSRDGFKFSRGYTQDEPSLNAPPRLFGSKKAAQCALTWWLKGVTYLGYNDHGDETWHVYPKQRKANEMKIVRVGIQEAE